MTRITISFVNEADQRRHDTAAALMDLGDAAERLARELTATINDTFPVAEEPGDAADTLYVEADLAAGAVWQIAGLIRRTVNKIV
jgi:hypothetical protein